MAKSDTTIKRYVVYPAIGIARVGNAEKEYFLGPEAPGEVPQSKGGFKDKEGRVKRQAARFRIYGLNKSGQAVKEITADDAEINWRVHLVNRKAGWYEFNNAMDLGKYAMTAVQRNKTITGAARQKLIIDPGPRQISGRNTSGKAYRFDTGEFMGTKVPLGELRTDAQGRLIVLGGYGSSASYENKPATTFANNEGWHDDVSDGPVRATLKINGKSYEAEPAMVAVTPPNYGQGLYGVVTMYDVVYDLFHQNPKWKIKAPERPSFWRDIYPIFERLVGNQWVNSGVSFLFGENSPSDLTSRQLLAQLADPAEESKPLRNSYFKWFRDPAGALGPQEPVKIPPFYGDAFGDFTGLGMDDLAVTLTQYEWLKQWAAGNFDPDPKLGHRPRKLEDYAAAEQPHALTRANLESCLGGPFHPGIELTWPLRVESMWREPFRLNILPEGVQPKDDYGPSLTPEEAMGPGGIVESSGPGTLTMWLGVPWQTDGASCLSGYELGTYLLLPSFWAARVPNQVLSERSYERVLDAGLPVGQRMKHFSYRPDWLRFFDPTYEKRINANVANWHKLGIVAEREGPGEEGLPSRLWVETQVDKTYTESDHTWKQVLIAEKVATVDEKESFAEMVANELEAEKREVPAGAGRRILRRNEL